LFVGVGDALAMSAYLRPRIPGATIFFTLALEDRGSDALVRHAGALRVAVRRTMAERPFRIEACVILPDHLHMIWTLPAGDSDFPNRWRVIKARFTQALPGEGLARASHKVRRERGLWQRRYWEHHVRSPAELAALTRYCWMNPVKHGLVADPFDWSLSSIHRDGVRGMTFNLDDPV
jgi:putative transposase